MLGSLKAGRICAVALAAAMRIGAPAQAALINEGAYTLDTDTGLEWLNLTYTDELAYNSVVAGAGGWIASGWQVATPEQFATLVETYIGPPTYTRASPPDTAGYSSAYFDAAWGVIYTLGGTKISQILIEDGGADAAIQLIGFLGDGSFAGAVTAAITSSNNDPAVAPFGEWVDGEWGSFNPYMLAQPYFDIGTFLVCDTSNCSIPAGTLPPTLISETPVTYIPLTPIPEPSTWAMMLLGFVGLGYAGFRRARTGRTGSTGGLDVWRSAPSPGS